MISRIIKVEVGVISLETLIILDITETRRNGLLQKPNLIIVSLYIGRNKNNSYLCFFTDGKQNKASELDMITLRNHAPRSYTT